MATRSGISSSVGKSSGTGNAGQLAINHDELRSEASAATTQNRTESKRANLVSGEAKKNKASVLKKPAAKASENTRNAGQLQTAFAGATDGPARLKATNTQPKKTSNSEKIKLLQSNLNNYQQFLLRLRAQLKQQAENPVINSVEQCRNEQIQIVEEMTSLENDVLSALKKFEIKKTQSELNLMDDRREALQNATWPLAQCEHSRPAIAETSSVTLLLEKFSKISNWCANYLDTAMASHENIQQQLNSSIKNMEKAERAGVAPNVKRKEDKKSLLSIQSVSAFLFGKLMPSAEIAYQHADLSIILADLEPKIRAHGIAVKKQIDKEFGPMFYLAVRYEYEKMLNDAELNDLEASTSGIAQEGLAEIEQASSQDDEHASISEAELQEARAQPKPLSGKQGRRPRRSKPEATASVNRPKYENLRTVRATQQYKQAAREALSKLAEDAYEQRMSAIEFYNDYGKLRADNNAGWIDHLALLDNPKYRLAAFEPMRTQVGYDVKKFLNNPDRYPADLDKVFMPLRETDDAEMHGQAMIFLTRLRAFETSTNNSDYAAYAAQQLESILMQASELPGETRETLMLEREISLSTASDEEKRLVDAAQGVSLQPKIFLSSDKRFVEVLDTSVAGTDLSLAGAGFRTSLQRAAELLAAGSTSSIRTLATPQNKFTSRPATPLSAAWMQSLSHVVPELHRTGSVVETFSDSAVQVQIKLPV